jgi:two-component system OmpR family response regulator
MPEPNRPDRRTRRSASPSWRTTTRSGTWSSPIWNGRGSRRAALSMGALSTKAEDAFAPDLVVLDLMMPGEDGLSICRRIAPRLPVLVLSAKGEDVDRIIGLEVGADDYLAKPFNPRELVARIRAILRRRALGPADTVSSVSSPPSPDTEPREVLSFEGWVLDVDGRRLAAPSGNQTSLSSGEFALLTEFARRPRRVLTRDQLLDLTRGRDTEAFDRAIDVQLSRLRRKLSAHGGEDLIKTIRNEGYLFSADVTRLGVGGE